MDDLKSSLASSIPSRHNVTEQPPKSTRTLSLVESFNDNLVGSTSQSLENFCLSNYEDDDDDSGFCCPCCLPR